jgi:hypothetical protein
VDGTLQLDQIVPPGHGYGQLTIALFIRLVLNGVSFRGASRVLAVIAGALGYSWKIPHWTSGRLWMLRLGHHQLTMAREQAADWAWLVDHSVQIGLDKCLVILGVRLSQMPAPGRCLDHRDVRLIALEPMRSSSKQQVHAQLEKAAIRTGTPRVIVDDHGADLHGGVKLFQQNHAQTLEVYDIKHKAACLLKHRLKHDPDWKRFLTRIGQTRCAIQQTELAFLAPPGAKLKARFMNLRPMLEWGLHVLEVLRRPPEVVREACGGQRLTEKLGWIESFGPLLGQWRQWQQVADEAIDQVGHDGLDGQTANRLRLKWSGLAEPGSRALAEELIEFVDSQSAKARAGERLPGSTEVVESLFGRFKTLEKQQARGGFTALVLAMGSMLSPTDGQTISQALKQSPTQSVWGWCRDKLGVTLNGKRKLAFAGVTAAQQNRDDSSG